MSFGIFFHGESHIEVFFDSVDDVEEVLDDGLVSLDSPFKGFFNDGGHESDEDTETFLGGEFVKSLKKGSLDTSVSLKEFISSCHESFLDNSSAVLNNTEDGVIFGLKVMECISFSLSLLCEDS